MLPNRVSDVEKIVLIYLYFQDNVLSFIHDYNIMLVLKIGIPFLHTDYSIF